MEKGRLLTRSKLDSCAKKARLRLRLLLLCKRRAQRGRDRPDEPSRSADEDPRKNEPS